MSGLNIKLECLESVGSTNSYLKEKARKGAPEGTLVIANSQTAGKGRMGRSFYSPQGLGLYMSLLLRPHCDAGTVPSLTAFTAVAVCRAIESVSKLKPEIKWINDITLGGKKVCGILCESSVSENGTDFAVIGIGLNVIDRVEDFPEALKETAGSLYSEGDVIIERGTLAAAIVRELGTMYDSWCRDKTSYLAEYKARCRLLGEYLSIGGRDAIAEDISKDFGLAVRYLDGGRELLYSGEVSIRG